jgi:hypothetical protein
VNFSKFKKAESFENISEKLIHAKFQLFNTFLTFSQENIWIFQETTKANFKNMSMQFILKLAKQVHVKF